MVNDKIRSVSEFEMQPSNSDIESKGESILSREAIDLIRVTSIHDYIGGFWKRILGGEAFCVLTSFLMRCENTNNTILVTKKELSEENAISIERVNKSIKRLKKFCFIQNILSEGHSRNLYIVHNKTIPLIPHEEYMKFPEDMKSKHDEYLQCYFTTATKSSNIKHIR